MSTRAPKKNDTQTSATDAPSEEKKLPIASWRLGSLQAACYHETVTREGGEQFTSLTVTFGKRIQDRNGNWMSIRTLNPPDIAPMMAILQEAQTFVLRQQSDETSF